MGFIYNVYIEVGGFTREGNFVTEEDYYDSPTLFSIRVGNRTPHNPALLKGGNMPTCDVSSAQDFFDMTTDSMHDHTNQWQERQEQKRWTMSQ
jgi:hypothetical protein